ncbi:hypothetical protein G112A_00358 [Candidatus Nanosynsacchari sp. TM7_G1_3_12Alb]|nr:hypothetical protein G112A_00358 [Candidatus Nanosynsacchari sp. TM7_G1_3_12Alb]
MRRIGSFTCNKIRLHQLVVEFIFSFRSILNTSVRIDKSFSAIKKRVQFTYIIILIFNNMISTKSSMTLSTFNKRVSEGIHMPTRLPDLLIHQNRRIDAVHIIALVDKPTPPQIHDITLQLHAQRAVIPGTAQAAVHI